MATIVPPPNEDNPPGWAFSDEAAARDAGLIPPDPFAPAEVPENTEGPAVSASAGASEDDNATHRIPPDDAGSRGQDREDAMAQPESDQPIGLAEYPAQPGQPREPDVPEEPGFPNDSYPPH